MQRGLVVAQYGRSLILESVGKRLAQRPGLRVVTLEGATRSAVEALDPDVLLVDLGLIDIATAVDLIDARPDMLLVGLEGSGARLLMLSAPQARAMTTDDLVGLIERRVGLVAAPA